MELRHLKYFVVVAEEQNVTRASERLHVSQPPLSRQMRDLEEELGVDLFRRTAKSLALTAAGKVFLREARAVLRRSDQAVRAVQRSSRSCEARLAIGYAPSLTAEFLPRVLREFERQHPAIFVALHELSSEECVQRLSRRRLDLALTVAPRGLARAGMIFERIMDHEVLCAVAKSHPLARHKSVAFTELREERFIIFTPREYPEYGAWIRQLGRPAGFRLRIAGAYDGSAGLITAVEAGQGIALVAASLRCLTGPRLAFLTLRPAPAPVTVGILRLRQAPAAVEKFAGVVRSHTKL